MRRGTQKNAPSHQNLSRLPTALCLEKKMGKGLGPSGIL